MLIVDGQQKGKNFSLFVFFIALKFNFLQFFIFSPHRKNIGASTISSALNAHAGNLNGNVSFKAKNF